MLSKEKALAIGQKIADSVKASLNEAGFPVKLEKIGGTTIRSMILDIDGGKISIT